MNKDFVWIDDSNRDDLNITSGGSVWPGYIPGIGFGRYEPINHIFYPIKKCKYCRSEFASDFIMLTCPQCGAPY